MELLSLSQAVAQQLDRLDFSALYPGYHRFPFALYNEERVCLEGQLFPWDDRFLGNTSIEYEGQRIAIWSVALDPLPPVSLAASMAHEMFHCFQFEQGEHRFPDDLRLLNAPTEQDFYQLKLAENCALAIACRTGDAAEFRRFAALRNERAAHFPQIAAEEWKAETIEGMAETVCLRALRVLDPARYAEALACYLAKLENELPLLFDARRLCYYTGTVLCLTLERLGLPFYNDFTGTTLYEQNRPTDALCFEAPEVPALAALFAEHLKEQQTTLAAHRQARPFHPCEAAICGYDPMNMFRMDQWLYCSHFLFIRQDGAAQQLHGPVLAQLAPGSDYRIIGYY